MSDIKKDELLDILKYGYKWHSEKIKDELEKLLIMNSRAFNHELQYDINDKFHYVYDNECYLFVFDEKIELRCDREDVFSAGQTFEHGIRNADNIHAAYEHFKAMTMEAEDE